MQKKDLEQRKRELEEAKAIYYYREARKASEEKQKYIKELELMNKKEPELKERLIKTKKILKPLWYLKKEDLTKAVEIKREKLEQLKQGLQQLNEKLRIHQKQRDNLKETVGKLDAWFKQYEHKKINVEERINKDAVLDPISELIFYRNQLKELKKEEENIKVYVHHLEKDREKLTQNIIAVEKGIAFIKNKLINIKRELKEFEAHRDIILKLLAKQERHVHLLFEKKDDIFSWIKNYLLDIQEKKK